MEETVFQPQHYATKFVPEDYLEYYYSSEALSEGTRLGLFALPTFAQLIASEVGDSERETLIDIGAGPTIYSALCFRNVVKRVFLCDFLQKNLELLHEWLHVKGSFDWSAVTNVVLKMEGTATCSSMNDMVEEAEERARLVVRMGGVGHADVHVPRCALRSAVLQFDVLVSVFCLESACTTYEQYENAARNMLELLRPGGRLVLGSVLDDDRYCSGKSRHFSLLRLDEGAICATLQKNGIDLSTMKTIVLREEGVIFLHAVKLRIPPPV